MINRKAILGAVLGVLTLYRTGSGQLVFPHFAHGGGYQTIFTLTNLSGSPTAATVELFLASGAPVTNVIIPLAPNGTGKAAVPGSGFTVGWARVTASPSAALVGLETIQLIKDGNIVADASVLPAIPDTDFRFPVVERNGVETGVAIANPGPVNAIVNLLLRDQSGVEIATQALPIGGSQQVARFVTEFFHGIGAFEGSIEISSASPIAVVALKQLPSGIFSVLPGGQRAANTSEVFFSPGGGIAARIVQEIQRARISIDIAIYTFTETEIANALIAAKNRGVAIRIIADSEEAIGAGSVIPRLEKAGFQLKRTAGIGTGIMHNKYAIFDGQVLLTGSYNWSFSAENSNFENAIFVRDPAVISSYQANFVSIWKLH